MTDDIRQEAVERAARGMDGSIGDASEGRWGAKAWLAWAECAIDASGLIEQLTEAISQRDEANDVNLKLRVIIAASGPEVVDLLREQLAAERALCDRLAAAVGGAEPIGRVLADYDALRATERET